MGPPAGGPGLYPRAGRVDPGLLERQRAAPRRLDRADLHGPGAHVTLSAFGVELFPTSSRSTAAGLRLVFVTLGGSLGLFLEALLSGVVVSHRVAIGALATLA